MNGASIDLRVAGLMIRPLKSADRNRARSSALVVIEPAPRAGKRLVWDLKCSLAS